MPGFAGKFDCLDSSGAVKHSGAGRFVVDDGRLSIAAPPAAPLMIDLGDVDFIVDADYRLSIRLFSGASVQLSQLGRMHDQLARVLGEQWRQRTIQCLLMSDLDLLDAFDCTVAGSTADGPFTCPGQIRLYKSNIAVLTEGEPPFMWRLADVDQFSVDDNAYAAVIQAGRRRLMVSRLARRTDEFVREFRAAMDELASQACAAIGAMLPFLDAHQLQVACSKMREGHSVELADLGEIDARIPGHVMALAPADQQPYVQHLASLAMADQTYFGFKLVREIEQVEESDERGSAGGPPASRPDILPGHDTDAEPVPESTPKPATTTLEGGTAAASIFRWFFFPIADANGRPRLVAWESPDGGGKATYFFRLEGDCDGVALEQAITHLGRALCNLNFRREPIYLSDDALKTELRLHHYVVAARRLADVRFLRSSFAGRAIHTSLEAWKQSVGKVLSAAL